MSALDKLFDENNEENIVLFDDDGNKCEFQQVALIPYEDAAYALLHPVNVSGVDEGELVVFFVDEEKEVLTMVTDKELGGAVFDEFMRLLDEDE